MSYLGVDTGVTGLSTSVTPGHNTLKLTIAHHGATGVTLREIDKEGEKDCEIEREREEGREREREREKERETSDLNWLFHYQFLIN